MEGRRGKYREGECLATLQRKSPGKKSLIIEVIEFGFTGNWQPLEQNFMNIKTRGLSLLKHSYLTIFCLLRK